MFKLLRRVLQIVLLMALGAFGYWLWQHPEHMRPAVDFYHQGETKVKEAINAPQEEKKILGEVTGRVTRVYSGDAFQITDATGVFNWRLTALQAPELPASRATNAPRTPGDASREFLASLVISNAVRIAVIHSVGPQASDGIVFAGTNNVNLAMLSAGMAQLNPRLTHFLPEIQRHEMERAQEQARAAKLGIWADAAR
ncbi:MAG: thermonuclease family protein [Verrucomicrobia bacterium]|nr:thermonuclease family protein [Verrucomicrobiota bacterium]